MKLNFWGGMKNQSSLELKLAGDLPSGQSGLVALWCPLLLLSVLIYQCPYFIAVVAPGCHIWRLLHTFITPRVSQPEGWCLCLISKKKNLSPTKPQIRASFNLPSALSLQENFLREVEKFLIISCSFPFAASPWVLVPTGRVLQALGFQGMLYFGVSAGWKHPMLQHVAPAVNVVSAVPPAARTCCSSCLLPRLGSPRSHQTSARQTALLIPRPPSVPWPPFRPT